MCCSSEVEVLARWRCRCAGGVANIVLVRSRCRCSGVNAVIVSVRWKCQCGAGCHRGVLVPRQIIQAILARLKSSEFRC